MKQKAKQSGVNQTLRRLGAEKKKIAIAALLVGVMGIMWMRILVKKQDPSAGGASLAIQTAAAEEIPPKIKITYVELPQVKGRNDVLSRDIFAGSRWEGLGAEANGARQMTAKVKGSNEQLNDIVNEMNGKELRLEAIFSGKNPQALVSGVLVSPGGRLAVKHEGEKYEFKAVAIHENEVVLVCKGVQVKLSMVRPTDSAN
jgi:hypothetical protein